MTDVTPDLKITKIEYGFTVPMWVIDAFNPEIREPATDEDTQLLAHYRAALKAWEMARVAYYARARVISKGYLRDLAELHAPNEHGECEGCDSEGYEAEYPTWPCRTAAIILKANGFDLPKPDYPDIEWRGTGRRQMDALNDIIAADLAQALGDLDAP